VLDVDLRIFTGMTLDIALDFENVFVIECLG
jgi:hypothetical protein